MATATEKTRTVRINGCVAAAQAAKYADVDVITAYPIRPYTATMMALAQMVANGELDAEYIVADSEHSQLSIAHGASSSGARVFTGRALAAENLFSGLDGKAALEHRAPGRRPLLFRAEKAPRPFDGPTKGLLPSVGVASAVSERIERRGQSRGEVLETDDLDRRSGKLDGQRNPLELAHDSGHQGRRGARESKARLPCAD